jgi:hypothetical protein
MPTAEKKVPKRQIASQLTEKQKGDKNTGRRRSVDDPTSHGVFEDRFPSLFS